MLNRDKAQAERSERLISLIKEYGRDWETIATKLGTDYTVKNCRRRGLYVANKMTRFDSERRTLAGETKTNGHEH